MSRSIDLVHAVLEFDTRFVVCRAIEGMDLMDEHVSRICAEIESRMTGDYGIILDEVNPYSMRFEAMVEFRNNPRIRCFAIAAYRPVTYGTTKMAFFVIRKPYRVFPGLEEAKVWMSRQMNEKTS